jgi:hypothetical protein
MNLVFVSMLMLPVVPAEVDEGAIVKHLKGTAQVYAQYGNSRQQKQLIRLELRITGDKDAKEVVAALKEVARLPHLETLMLMGPAFTDEAVRELARSRSLRDVQLNRTQVTDAGIASLAAINELRRLVFWGSGLTDKGLKDVARLKNLKYLEITDAPITREGLKELYALTGLRRLTIVNSKATARELRLLFQSLPELETRPLNGFQR